MEKSLDYSIKDGSFYSVMAGFGDTYLTAFALRLGATNAEIGFLAAIPQLIASISQQVSARVTEITRQRKKLIVTYALLHGIVWLPILLTPFLFPQTPVAFLIFFACLYASFAAFAALPWASLMGDLVPEETRGKFFGKRNEITGFVAFLSAIIAGSTLGWFDANGELISSFGIQTPSWILGFSALFFIAFVARMASVGYLAKMSEPEYTPPKEREKSSLAHFLRHISRENFGVFTLYASGTQFATYLAAPFFTVYLLSDLKIDYGTFAIYAAVSTFTQLISMPYWGRLADKFGNKTVLNVVGFLIPFIPIAFIFSSQPVYLILINAISGFVWAGFNLLTFNYILDATEPSTRPRYIANYNFLSNLAMFSGALIGGGLATFFAGKSIFFVEGLLLLFLLSGLLRLAIAFALLHKVKENRLRYDLNEHEFFWKVAAIYPARGIIQQLEGAWHLGEHAVKEGAKTAHTLEEKAASETIKLGERIKSKLKKQQKIQESK